jgi:hypothetical protein
MRAPGLDAWRRADDELRARTIAAWVVERPTVSWLDGGQASRSVVGLETDCEIETDDVGAIAAVDRAWRADRERHGDRSAIWIGCITYDFAADVLLGRTPRRQRLPGCTFRRHPTWLRTGPGGHVDACGDVPPPDEGACVGRGAGLQPLVALWSAQTYRERVQQVLEHIAAGDTYQVNLAQRFFAPWRTPCAASTLPAWAVDEYLRMRGRAPAERGALLRLGDGFVLSNSPETLVDVELGATAAVARARPIKGTRPRGATPEGDADARDALRGSAKDRAEHVMIVDLVRNDLGRLAQTGSVRAPSAPQSLVLPTVHHLVSEVEAVLRPGVGLPELFAALVPGGSVTGAPKRRTVEIIEALEQAPRGIYCGAIVLLAPEGLRMSIPIRTAMADVRGLHLHAGGGIVIDSDPEAERAESIAKTQAFVG